MKEKNLKEKMKKAMWVISILCLIGTAVVINFMPEKVPMHYDASGTIDRWGSRMEKLIFPIGILCISLFWHLLIHFFEKKAGKEDDEKERAAALSNANLLSVVGVANAVMQTIIHAALLYASFIAIQTKANEMTVDIGKVICVSLGLFFIVIGNYMPKTRLNGVVGLRTSWSMYNDNTWRRSNHFGAVMMMIIGVVAVVAGLVLTNSLLAILITLCFLIFSVIVIVAYSHKVYVEEKSAEI